MHILRPALSDTQEKKVTVSNLSEKHGLKSNGFIVLMLILQIVVYFVVYADIPIARMVICFLYLMFVPGVVILKLLAPRNLDITEKVFFSVGLSIAFLMFIGLAINEIAKLAVTDPLSLNFLIISINTVILLMSFIGAKRDDSSLSPTQQLKHSKSLFLILLSASLVLLGSYGITIVNISGNSFFLLLMILAISIVVSLVFLSEKIIPSNSYPLILFVILICSLFFVSSSYSLVTRYITGNGDQWLEYYAFRLTETNHLWNSAAPIFPNAPTLSQTLAMLSVTILPSIFSTITGLDGSWVFKLLYPLVVSFIALGTYKLYQTQTDNKTAFLATFLLITVSVGKGLGPSKQEIAQLFYVSLFLLLFKREIFPSKRNVLLIIFSVGLVVSHYSLSYIFLFTILLTFLILAIMDYRKKGQFSIYQTKIPLTLVLFFLTIAFSWYIFVSSSAAFNYFAADMNTVRNGLGQFFNPASRGTALAGLGVVQTPTIFASISAALFIVTELLLFVGFIKLLTSKNKTSKFSTEYKVIATLNMAILAANILLPNLANTFLMTRFYQTTLIILAPLAILGGKTIIELVPKPNFRRFYAAILVFTIFIPFFLFQTSFVFEVTKVQSYSLPLSMYRWDNLTLYGYIVNDQEVDGAQWLLKYTNVTNVSIYSDLVSQENVLTAYGMIEGDHLQLLLNTTRLTSNDLAYLANAYLINGIFNASQISPILENQNKLYSNGQCEIYEGCAP